ITVNTDWVTTATAEGSGVKAFQVGPPLPDAGVNVVQASGGHTAPAFYVGDPNGAMRLWKLVEPVAAPRARRPRTGFGPTWRQLVPATGPTGTVPKIARRYFVDPYRANRLYVLGSDHVYRSDNGGGSWVVDISLESALTENGAFPLPSRTTPIRTKRCCATCSSTQVTTGGAMPLARPASSTHSMDSTGARWSAPRPWPRVRTTPSTKTMAANGRCM